MKCANHPDTDAIGLCTGCQRALCPDCQIGEREALCSGCLVAHNQAVAGHFYKQLAISGVILAASLFFLSRAALTWEQVVIGALALTFLPFGWSALSRFFDSGGGYYHPLTRFFSLTVHLVFSAMLGWLVGPWQIYKATREILKAKEANLTVSDR